MNGELDKLSDWLLANKLSLNETKTDLLIVRPKNTKYPEHSNIKINNHKLIPVTYVKYLGCIIDEHLTWNQHVKVGLSPSKKKLLYLVFSTIQRHYL